MISSASKNKTLALRKIRKIYDAQSIPHAVTSMIRAGMSLASMRGQYICNTLVPKFCSPV
jgi:hypothetical protein